MPNSLLSSAVIAVIIVTVSGCAVSYNADMGTVADTAFIGLLDTVYAAHVVLNLTATDNITDGDGSYELEGARGITAFTSGGDTYIAVASYDDAGVQILNVTDSSNIIVAGKITDTAARELGGASGITTFTSGGDTYAAVASYLDHGVQFLNITNPL